MLAVRRFVHRAARVSFRGVRRDGEVGRLLTAVVAAACVALVSLVGGGSLRALSDTYFRWTPLLFAGLAIQISFVYWSPPWLDGSTALAIILVSNVAVLAFIVANRQLPGLILAGVGLLLNLIVITANGAMPVLERSAQASGVSAVPEEAAMKHEPLDGDTVVPWLADVIPVRPFREVLSLGDVMLALGLCYLVHARMTSGSGPRHGFTSGVSAERRDERS